MKRLYFVISFLVIGLFGYSQKYPENWIKVKDDYGLYGFIEKTLGKKIIPCMFLEIGEFGIIKEDWALVVSDEMNYGIINTKGEIVLNADYDSIEKFENDSEYAIISSLNLKGLINRKGEIVVYPQYSEIELEQVSE